MAVLGYEGVFTPRTQAQGHVWDDGIAIFVLHKKYDIQETTAVHYNDLAKGNRTHPNQVCHGDTLKPHKADYFGAG